MGWLNTHVVTTEPITDTNGILVPKGSEFIVIYGTKRDNDSTVARFRSIENGKLYRFLWKDTKNMKPLIEKPITNSAFWQLRLPSKETLYSDN